MALDGPFQKSDRRVAERRRGKTVAWDGRDGTVTREDTNLERVVQLHVTPFEKR
jgi:hypothetical protein